MMRRLRPDTLFSRLFSLLLWLVILSHASILISLAASTAGVRFPEDSVAVLREGEVVADSLSVVVTHPGLVTWKVITVLWPVMGMVLVALILAAWFGAGMLTTPIRRLSEAAARLGDNLDGPQIAEVGPSEARQAARIFNTMQERLRAQIRQRATFLAAVSHDLRTPLTRIKLRVEQVGDEALKAKIRADLDEMADMLDATLEFLRDEADNEPRQRLDIQALAESLAENAREIGRTVTVCGGAAPLMAQPGLLRRCLSNLIENALRYGHTARISLRDSAAELVIEVEDDGPGIPEDKMEAVFEPFVRLESSRNKHSGGFGLGLAVAREAALRHGADLRLANRREGGLIARLSFPRPR